MTSSSDRPEIDGVPLERRKADRRVNPGTGNPYARFIPREEMPAFAAWSPNAFGTPTTNPLTGEQTAAPAAAMPTARRLPDALGGRTAWRARLAALPNSASEERAQRYSSARRATPSVMTTSPGPGSTSMAIPARMTSGPAMLTVATTCASASGEARTAAAMAATPGSPSSTASP